MSPNVPVVAIDGPSGSGKGTIADGVAKHLGWHRLDSGALYRCVGLAASRRGVALTDTEGLEAMTGRLDLVFDGGTIRLDGDDVTEAIRSESAGQAASTVAALPGVRAALLARQRAFAVAPGLVADGRDMGTVVFPDAALKVFLTASAEARAHRRHKQLKEKGIDVSLRGLSSDIAQRDRRDENRAVAPLRPAEDARVVDSTRLAPEEVIDRILPWLRDAGIETDVV